MLCAAVLVLLCLCLTDADAQIKGDHRPHVALKTNLLSDITLTPHAEVEVYWGKRWSTAIGGALSWINTDDRTWRIRSAQLSGKYWISPKQVGEGYYIGVYGQVMDYDIRLSEVGYLGRRPHIGLGLSGGRGIRLSSRLSLDLGIRIGYLGGERHSYRTGGACDCAEVLETIPVRYFGPTGAEIALVYHL